MAVVDDHHHHRHKKWRIFPFWQSAIASSSASSTQNLHNQSQGHTHQNGGVASNTTSSSKVSSVARLLLPGRRRLRLDPSSNLYFPYEPGKQARSAVRIKNSSKSHVAFKFQTTAPKSCYMRPPGGILAPGESIIATVFKFVEQPENNEKPLNQRRKVKFKIVSLKVKEGTEYVPELFDEQREQVIVERVLRVVFLDPERSNSALEKLKRQLAEADAAVETRKKPPAETGPRMIGEGLVIDEWKERREKYLARQQVEAGVDPIFHREGVDLEMADAAVEFLLENLKQLLIYHSHLIGDAKHEIERLEMDLRLFKAFLRDCTRKRRKDERLRVLVRQIREVVYDAEDIIDAFVTQAAEGKSKSYFVRAFQTPVKLNTIAIRVEIIGAAVRDYYGEVKIDFASLGVGDGWPAESEAPSVRQDIVVGFEDEAEMLIGYLTEETHQLDVISVIGMPGLGKTTLAGKIFHDPGIQYEFPTRIWVYISQEFTKKDVFLNILRVFTRLTEDMYRKTDQDLAQLICFHLEKGKFLIVMDDVWTAEDWDKLKVALPKNNKMGKVLITSRNEEVARHANCYRAPHRLRFLNQEESWLLLQLEVFGERKCPPDLEVVGRLIAQLCGGLPLALVVIGGILAKKSSTGETSAMKEAWEKVSESVTTYLNMDSVGRMERIISTSYDKLPFHLRACFLYFGMFPEDFEIPAWKLIRMWIAEGFIQQKTSGISLEETAENYLEELISRNLVRVDKIKPDGKVKTCRIHDMLRDFCILEARNEGENFLQEMKRSRDGGFEPPVSDVHNYRRLCIHSNVVAFLSSKPYGPRVRSFVCFSKEDINLPPENSSAIPAAFKLLRVLDVNPIRLTRIPSDLYHLVHLRYITLSINSAILPAAFNKLWNIQTLIIDTTSRTLDIKADIWKMIQLRYLKTNASAILPKQSKSSKGVAKLQTLGTISPQNCTKEVFDRTRDLKKLAIRGRLSFLLDGRAGSFDSLQDLNNLEKLTLLNDVFPSPASEGRLQGLPPPYTFPPQLRSLTLADTFLDWSRMSVLGFLLNLEVLKLKDKAFMGPTWIASDGGFRNLEVLQIGRTDLVFWEASAHHFPRLKQLELLCCEDLREVPFGLADIPSLQLLKLYRSKYAAASAKKIHEAKQKKLEQQTSKVSIFELSIFPPVVDQL